MLSTPAPRQPAGRFENEHTGERPGPGNNDGVHPGVGLVDARRAHPGLLTVVGQFALDAGFGERVVRPQCRE